MKKGAKKMLSCQQARHYRKKYADKYPRLILKEHFWDPANLPLFETR